MAYNRIEGSPKFFIDAALLARQWGQIEYAHEDKFFLNPSFDDKEVSLVTLEQTIPRVGNKKFENFLETHPETMITFELERDPPEKWISPTREFVEKYKDRRFCKW